MTRKKLSMLLGSICLVLVLAALPFMAACVPEEEAPPVTPTPPEEEVPEEELPEVVTIASFGTGTTGHAIITALALTLEESTGIKIIPIPRETEVGRFLSCRTGETHFAFTTALSASAPVAGITEFSAEEWGPQPLYRIWQGPNRAGVCASAVSGAKTLYDIKGLRFPWWPGTSGVITRHALLAYANLTEDDVVRVDCPSFAAQIRAAKVGETDVWWLGLYGSYTIEIAGKPNGLVVLNLPEEDKEAWERLQSVGPFFAPTYYEGLPGEVKSAWSISYPYVFYCYPWVSDELAYTLTKAFWEGYDQYKDKHPELVYFDHDYALSLGKLPKGYPPYHPGSVKFFTEIGVWTPEHEKWQALCIKLGEERAKAWKEAQLAAKEKGIKLTSDAWPEFWESFLVDYLEDRGLPVAPARHMK